MIGCSHEWNEKVLMCSYTKIYRVKRVNTSSIMYTGQNPYCIKTIYFAHLYEDKDFRLLCTSSILAKSLSYTGDWLSKIRFFENYRNNSMQEIFTPLKMLVLYKSLM